MAAASLEAKDARRRGVFETTRWSLVLAANDASSGSARKALDELCRMYRYPLYCFVRRAGHQHADAEDLVQGFFAQLFAREFFAQAEARKGRLRGFLVSSLRYHLLDAGRRAAAARRGGGVEFVPLDLADAEQRFTESVAGAGSPEQFLDRAWAVEVLQRALLALREEWLHAGRGDLFEALHVHILAPLAAPETQRIAERCGLTEEHVKVALHRLRKGFGAALRRVVAETVESEAEIELEIAALRAALT